MHFHEWLGKSLPSFEVMHKNVWMYNAGHLFDYFVLSNSDLYLGRRYALTRPVASQLPSLKISPDPGKGP